MWHLLSRTAGLARSGLFVSKGAQLLVAMSLFAPFYLAETGKKFGDMS